MSMRYTISCTSNVQSAKTKSWSFSVVPGVATRFCELFSLQKIKLDEHKKFSVPPFSLQLRRLSPLNSFQTQNKSSQLDNCHWHMIFDWSNVGLKRKRCKFKHSVLLTCSLMPVEIMVWHSIKLKVNIFQTA